MKKKIVAVILAVVMLLTISVPVFAEDEPVDVAGSFNIQDILNNEEIQDIIATVMGESATWDIVNRVMEIIAIVGDKEGFKDKFVGMAKDEISLVLVALVNQISDMLKKFDNNKDLFLAISPFDVVKNLLGDKHDKYETTLPDRDETWSEGRIGDIDGNGKVTAADARLVLRASAKLVKLTPAQAKYADVDRDGKITATDARIILRVASKLTTFDRALAGKG